MHGQSDFLIFEVYIFQSLFLLELLAFQFLASNQTKASTQNKIQKEVLFDIGKNVDVVGEDQDIHH